MKPSTEGQRLKQLREALRATQDLIADLAGLERVTITRAEGDKVKWRSTELKEGLMRAYSMTYEQLSQFTSGDMPLERALELARHKVERAIRADERRRAQASHLDDIFRTAEAQQELLQATKDAAIVVFSEVGLRATRAQLVDSVLALDRSIREHIREHIRALKSDSAAPK